MVPAADQEAEGKVAVVACMDARIVPSQLLGLEEGDAHVIRNAGGVVSDEEIRSLAISQNLLGTEEIILIHHTDCGMLTFDDKQFSDQLKEQTGVRPSWPALRTDFTDREGREVVVEHEPLVLLAGDVLDLLLIVGRAERATDERLRLAAREDDGAMHSGEVTGLRPSRRTPRSSASSRIAFSCSSWKMCSASFRCCASSAGSDARRSSSTASTCP